MNSYFDLIQARESCRKYSSRPVRKEDLYACAEAAGLAPSACNSQPWSFVIVHKPALSPEIAACLQEDGFNRFAGQCAAFILVFEEEALLINGRTGTKMPDQRFAQLDVGLAVSQLCLAATELGLSTCIMGSYNAKKLKQLLNYQQDENALWLVIGVGYAENDTARNKVRKRTADYITYID